VRAEELTWQPSPSPLVWRKRLFHQGAAESGVVTSVVRYDAGSTFTRHGHPEGEEICVLEGVFSDERGSFAAGAYMLNPDGFEHAPFSVEGCLLFVRLRQYPGLDRERVLLDTKSAPWVARLPGVRSQPLYSSPRYQDWRWLTELAPGTEVGPVTLPRGEVLFVLEGEFEDEYGRYPRHTWLRFRAGSVHTPRTATGCLLYVSLGL
jgi:anti-sigma factor ChrR (cupin superfamily)